MRSAGEGVVKKRTQQVFAIRYPAFAISEKPRLKHTASFIRKI
jgi:hypothetical protein